MEYTFPTHFQKKRNTDMKSEKLVSIHCQTILRVLPDLTPQNKFMLAGLDSMYKGSAVARTFEVWAKEHKYDDLRKPVSAFLKVASDLLGTDTVTIMESTVENAVVKKAAREIAYITDNQVSFSTKQKDVLKAAVEEEDYTYEDLLSAFRDFFQKLDTSNAKSLSFAPRDFSESAGDLMYAVRRKRQEKVVEAAAVDTARERMQQTAEAERLARQKAQEAEAGLIEDELGD